MVELLLGFLGTLPLASHLKQIVFILLRYVVIHSLHMLCDSFKSSSPDRGLYLGSENSSMQVKEDNNSSNNAPRIS